MWRPARLSNQLNLWQVGGTICLSHGRLSPTMTLRLILIRHAKSSWDNPLLDDHNRTLNERGRISANAIGKWLAEKHHLPDVVLCSTARRTVETWKTLSSHLANEAVVEISSALYLASAHQMLNLLSTVLFSYC